MEETKKRSLNPAMVWREARELMWAHRRQMGIGLVLMVLNRLAGLVLPGSSKFLIDDVIGQQRTDLLVPIAVAAGIATVVQASTSFGLSQVLSIAAQRAIADMRKRVHAHVLRLPVSYFDATKTGVLISRIMSRPRAINREPGDCAHRARGVVLSQLAAHGHHVARSRDVWHRDGYRIHETSAPLP
jgi:subfamily B ATP-binding cassette protein MsbA